MAGKSQPLLFTGCPNIVRDCNGLDAQWVFRVLDGKYPDLTAFAEYGFTPAGNMAHDKAFTAPFLHPGFDFYVFTIGSGISETGLRIHQRGTNNATFALGVAPTGNAADGEEFAAGGVEPFEIIGEEYNLRWVTVAESNA